MLKVNFSHSFDTQEFDVQVNIPAKGVTAVFGRSGSGKTTLLNVIAGLLTPELGEITLFEQKLFDSKSRVNVPTWERECAVVFQDSRLFPHMTVKQNLNYGRPPEVSNSEYQELLKLLDIEHLIQSRPHQLSGGEKQRVGIARALLSRPKLLLMDEPLASLDLPRKREVLKYLQKLAQNIDIPVVYVTHSLEEVMNLADNLLLLELGKLVQFGTVEEVWNSDSLSLWKGNEMQSSLINVEVCERHSQYAMRRLSVDTHSLWVPDTDFEDLQGKHMRLRVNASDVSVTLSRNKQSSIRNILPVTVSAMHRTSEHAYLLELELSADVRIKSSITVWAATDLELEVGKLVYAQIKGVSFTQQKLASH
ncbi:molybdenum transport ATP-binding protein modC [Vibrio ishigakensis]|uniref:Molybdenum transport ATP-binding protein modC n=1 Tax=Vibrio ishigakensis TaxID=1481914 RepID=A0A0B8QGP5_9VIBR|nr:molybdenum transport ATP-binding protein modC [Vibrio ishigakensis]